MRSIEVTYPDEVHVFFPRAHEKRWLKNGNKAIRQAEIALVEARHRV